MRSALSVIVVTLAACASNPTSPSTPSSTSTANPTAGSNSTASSTSPCASPESHGLDFWVGDWDVAIRSRQGVGAAWQESRGENHIARTHGGCVIEEHFRSDGPLEPSIGTSVSVYVPDKKTWRQTWVDDEGSFLAFTGGPDPSGLVALYGEPRVVNGREMQKRMTWREITHDHFLWTWESREASGWEPLLELRYARQPAPAPVGTKCDDDPVHHDLDFWLGDWTVSENGKHVGDNRIEKTLGGCAVTEHWRGGEGGEGESLFFVAPGTSQWKQVWITAHATTPGGSKEKSLIYRTKDAIRFQGEVPSEDGTMILDRTTLTRLPDGRVKQVIEVSKDRGRTWRSTFDAIYTRPTTQRERGSGILVACSSSPSPK